MLMEIEAGRKNSVKVEVPCYHCGVPCESTRIRISDKVFCCEGCKLVFEILNENGLCDYYKLQTHPGLSQIRPVRSDKYAYLDDDTISNKLFKFTDGKNVIVTFYIPGVHCASCMWLLDHLYRLDAGISESHLNFTTKELTVHFNRQEITTRKIVELLATIGYEPNITLEDVSSLESNKPDKKKIYKLGIAGFCFGNIMMMSFPEYFSGLGIEDQYAHLFRWLNLFLSLPVFFYCGSEFFTSAWKGIRQKMLNIDAPIVLALLITFSRSVYEILTNTGSGYLDSMSGIVFFMLIGRVVQERAYRSISFHRDYKAYFPLAVNVVTTTGIQGRNLQDIREKDIIQLYNNEIIPADGVVVKGLAKIDYSFVTGESDAVEAKAGERVYAGGKQVGEHLQIQVIKPVAGSYLTSLWNHHAFTKNKIRENKQGSWVHVLSRYFTYILFSLAAVTAIYWALNNPDQILPSVSAMLIVACPCALLLASTYTDGNLLRLLSNNGLFLRDASVIEQIGKIKHIAFDKTGTLTSGNEVKYSGHSLSEDDLDLVYSAALSSRHPYSKALIDFLGSRKKIAFDYWEETPGKGVEARYGNKMIKIGSAEFTGSPNIHENATVYINVNANTGIFTIFPGIRSSVPEMLSSLEKRYNLSLLSGDNDRQKNVFTQYFPKASDLLFNQKPVDKLKYIEQLQNHGSHVLMLGDGLNDAGALQQSNVGVTLADDINNFTPSCDAILDANKFSNFPALLKLASSGKLIITLSFIISILYNIVGLAIAMQGLMSPMIAAILMPVSTLSIVLLTTGLSSLLAKAYNLSLS